MKKTAFRILSLSIAACCLLFLSCKINTTKEPAYLQLNETASQQLMVGDSLLIPLSLNLWDWKIIGRKAVFFSPDNSENYCVIYDLDSKGEIEKIGRKGKGPDEFLSCNMCRMNGEGEFALYDVMKKNS